MKSYKYIKVFFLFVILSVSLVSSAEALVKYPVSELGGCKNKSACKQYCSISSNYLSCTDFGLKNNLISKEAGVRAKEFIKVLNAPGPGSCKDEAICKKYCSNISNTKECVAFAEKHDLIPANKITEVKQIVGVLQQGLALPGNCKDTETCNNYCTKKENEEECFNYARNSGLNTILLEGILKQAPPEAQGCIKSMIGNMTDKAKAGDLKGANDISSIVKDCLPVGAKIPPGGVINMEFLKSVEEFYGSSLPAKDLESLKQAQEQLRGKIPQGTPLPKSPLNLEDIKNINAKMQEELNKIPPEQLEYIRKQQEQSVLDGANPPEIQGVGGGGGMGL